jgi:hypothetical protein
VKWEKLGGGVENKSLLLMDSEVQTHNPEVEPLKVEFSL